MRRHDRASGAQPEPKSPGLRARWLGALVDMHPGEGRCALFLSAYAFVLMLCYYILKTLREPLLLAGASPEIKSYAYAAVAAVLVVLVPVYGIVFRRVSKAAVGHWLTVFFVVNLLGFVAAGWAGVAIGFIYYVWVGIFGVTILAQFWAHAADSLTKDSGERLFPAIMAAAAFGGLAGPLLVGQLFAALGPWPLMLLAATLLAATYPLIERSRAAVPPASRRAREPAPPAGKPSGCFGLVFHDGYLLLLAALMVLLNCVNTLGEYLLTELVVALAEQKAALDPAIDQAAWIAEFYGNYFLAINVLTVIAQLLLVSRLLRRIGVTGALCVLPAIALVGYSVLVFVPVFGVLQIVKILENSADYSVMNTSRQLLYLPLSAAEKYKGKIAIDTFFYRVGDLLQAGVVFVGLNLLGFDVSDFALLNALLAAVWLGVSLRLARRHVSRELEPAGVPLARVPFERWRGFALGLYRSVFEAYRNIATLLLTAALGTLVMTGSAPAKARAQAQPSVIMDSPEPGFRPSARAVAADRLTSAAKRAKQGRYETNTAYRRIGARDRIVAARRYRTWPEPRLAAAPRPRFPDRLQLLGARYRHLERR